MSEDIRKPPASSRSRQGLTSRFQSMDQSRFPPALADLCELRPMGEKKIGERRLVTRGKAMGGHPCRFVHDQDRAILVDNLNIEVAIGWRLAANQISGQKAIAAVKRSPFRLSFPPAKNTPSRMAPRSHGATNAVDTGAQRRRDESARRPAGSIHDLVAICFA